MARRFVRGAEYMKEWSIKETGMKSSNTGRTIIRPVSYTHLDVYKRQAEGAIGIAEKANKVRQKPLRVILNGLGLSLIHI